MAVKSVEYEGKTYEVRYAYKREEKLFFVCKSSNLFGSNKDEVAAESVTTVEFNDGTLVRP